MVKKEVRNYMIMQNDDTKIYDVRFCGNGDDTYLVNLVCKAQSRGQQVRIVSDLLNEIELYDAEKHLLQQGYKKGNALSS